MNEKELAAELNNWFNNNYFNNNKNRHNINFWNRNIVAKTIKLNLKQWKHWKNLGSRRFK